MKYMKLDQKNSFMAEYIWIDSNGGVRSKSKVSHFFIIGFSQTVSLPSHVYAPNQTQMQTQTQTQMHLVFH